MFEYFTKSVWFYCPSKVNITFLKTILAPIYIDVIILSGVLKELCHIEI